MGPVTSEVRELARMLLASEATPAQVPGRWTTAAERTWGLLRAHLVRLIGLDGYRVILSRSVALARVEAPWLESAQVAPDASLEGVCAAAAEEPEVDGVLESHAAVLAQLIGLLVLFIGAGLTRRLLGEIWPEVMLGDTLSHLEAKAER